MEEAGVSEPQNGTAAGFPRDLDDAIVKRASHGDHDAFREIVGRHEARLRVLAFHLLQDAHLMNDAVQDTFIKAYVALPGFRGDAALGTWLHRICYRVCLDYLRSGQSRPGEADICDDLADPLDVAMRLAVEDEVAVALGTLSVDHRAVLLLVDREGYDYGSVAEALEVPVGTVASRLSTARQAMRRALRPEVDCERSAR